MKRRAWWIAGVAGLAFAAWFLIGYFSALPACAHDPRFVCSPRDAAHPVVVPDPQKSWAFYGGLRPGQRDVFTFTAARPLKVPWSLLIDRRDAPNPARPEATLADASGHPLARLDLRGAKPFYEPFSRSTYLESPDRTLDLPPGTYRIEVAMTGGGARQRYVIAIGEDERFGIGEVPYVLGAIGRIRALRY